jgi:hypothetical protein
MMYSLFLIFFMYILAILLPITFLPI